MWAWLQNTRVVSSVTLGGVGMGSGFDDGGAVCVGGKSQVSG